MSDVIAEIKRALQEREQHELAIREIDLRLAQARQILGVTAPPARPVIPPQKREYQGANRDTRKRILDALSKHEPKTADELKEELATTTVSWHLQQMWLDKLVVRGKRGGSRRYYYARTERALDQFLGDSGEIDDGDLGPLCPPTAAVGGISSATETNGTAPTTSDLTASSAPLNNGNGHA